MGNLVTQAEVQARFDDELLIQLTDDNDAGSIDTTVLADYISKSEAETYPYLKVKYTLPLSSVPEILKDKVCDILIKKLYDRRQGPPEHIKENYKEAMRWLKMVADGKIDLGVATPAVADTGIEVSHTESDRTFTKTTLGNF